MKPGKISRRNFITGGALAVGGMAVAAAYSFIEPQWIKVRKYTVPVQNLPAAFEGFTILHLSDLHDKQFGKEQVELLGLIRQQKYDIIAITGDLVDKRNPRLEPGLELIRGLKDKPVYFVPGNHEWWSGYEMRDMLVRLGVRVLENRAEKLSFGQDHIWLLGVDDPYLGKDDLQAALKETGGEAGPKVLLAHAPEIFQTAVKEKVDIVLVGHTHGGQIRIPVVGAVVVPGQGLLPKFDYGLYTGGVTRMLITGGLGESVLPIRFNMPPEIVLVTLKGL